jgi:hypothetical protein
MSLTILITLVTLEALLVLAKDPTLLADPLPVIKFQIQPISGNIEIVETTSSQKKKVKK